jgi:trimeric autotransporter adhesin
VIKKKSTGMRKNRLFSVLYKKPLFLICFLIAGGISQSQVAINTDGSPPNPSAMLDIKHGSKGLLIPRVSLTGTNDVITVPASANSLLVYNTAAAGTGANVVSPGYYYWSGSAWVPFLTPLNLYSAGWLTTGNAGTSPPQNFIGTTDNASLQFKVNNTTAGWLGTNGNTFFGLKSGISNSGYSNVAIGPSALLNSTVGNNSVAIGDSSLFSQTGGLRNTAVGSKSGFANTTGFDNSFLGFNAGLSNTTGINNTFIGSKAGMLSTTGQSNTFVGSWAGLLNTDGWFNTFIGTEAGKSNSTGMGNTYIGDLCGSSNSTGKDNTAVGSGALVNNSSGSFNVALGAGTLFHSNSANHIVAVGDSAFYNNVSSGNTAVGSRAGFYNTTGADNSFIGYHSGAVNTTGSLNTFLGSSTGTANTGGNYNTFIGAVTAISNTTGENNTIVGVNAGYSNTTGNSNSFLGRAAGGSNTTASSNSFFGYFAGESTTTGQYNSFFGANAGDANTTGLQNAGFGYRALFNNTAGVNNVGIGTNAGLVITTGDANSFLGALSNGTGADLYNATAIGYGTIVNATNKVVVGNTTVTSIGGQVGWSTFSDGRFKKNIQENVSGLAFITRLRPVTYTLDIDKINHFLEPENAGEGNLIHNRITNQESIRYTGFIAQEVEQAAKETGYQFSGVQAPVNAKDNYSLVYAEFVVPLVKAVQEQQAQIKELKKEVDLLKKLIQNK